MKKWLTLGVCVTTLSMLTGIYPTFQSVHAANDTQSTSTTNTLSETSTTTFTTSVTESEGTTSTAPNTANTTSEVAVQAAVQEVKPIEGTIKNVNQENGTYDVVVKVNENVQSGIKQVLVPIWSDAQQKDIKWYEAKLQADGTWIVHMNFSEHQYHRATYHTHVYVYSNENKHDIKTVLDDTTIEPRGTKLSAKIQNVNTSTGSYDVIVYGSSSSGIHHVKVPIWSAKDQSDIKWYDAVKQADGSYLVHMNIANHKYHRGIYHTHVYMYNNDHSGRAIVVNNTNLSEINTTKLDAKIINVNVSSVTYDVVIKGEIESGVKEILVPIWSDKNQKDINWYKASKQADSSYLVHMNIANHKYNRGTYTTHVYMYGNNGKVKAKSLGYTNLPDINTKLEAEIKNVNEQKGTYDVVVKGQISSGIREIYVPIWSDKKQKDIKWYQAEKQPNGVYIVHMDIAKHKHNRGQYMTHVYMYGNNGKVKAKSLGYTEIKNLLNILKGSIVNVSQENKSFDVEIDAYSNSGIKEILVPIWSKYDQSDIKWYKAEEVADGKWHVHMQAANHKFHSGSYTTHVYMYMNNGTKKVINLGQTVLNNIAEITGNAAKISNIDVENGNYDVLIKVNRNVDVSKILVPTWSATDQSDIIWHEAKNIGDGFYKAHISVMDHQLLSGTYRSDVYIYQNGNKKTIGLSAGNVNLTKPYKIIDISEHQKPELIDYDELSKHIRGAIVRIQYGQNYVDKYYEKHIEELRKRNIPIAVYAWVRGQNYDQMVNEARLLYSRAHRFNPSFWWLDVEESGLMSQANNNVRSGVELYRSTLSDLGAKNIGLYIGNDKFKQFNVDTSKFQGLWIPTYGLDNGLYQGYNPTSTNIYDLHQYTSTGRISGYGYNLDISRLVNKKFNYFF